MKTKISKDFLILGTSLFLCTLTVIYLGSVNIVASEKLDDQKLFSKRALTFFSFKSELKITDSILTHEERKLFSPQNRQVFEVIDRAGSLSANELEQLDDINEVSESIKPALFAINLNLQKKKSWPPTSREVRITTSRYFSQQNIWALPLTERDVDQLSSFYGYVKSQFLGSRELKYESPVILYMLGDMGLKLWQKNKDMEGVVFITTLIKNNPETLLAKMSWFQLNSHVHFINSGSSGDNTPDSWRNFLSALKDIAFRGYPQTHLISQR